MAKKVVAIIKLALPAGKATPAPPVGPALGQHGANIAAFCKELGVRYTRYADDLTFSGDFDEKPLYEYVNMLLSKNGFELNHEKTRMMLASQRQIVTGIIVNDKPQLDKETRKQIRQEVYYIKKFGLESHMEKANLGGSLYLNQLMGKISFGLYLNPLDIKLRRDIKYLTDLYKKLY